MLAASLLAAAVFAQTATAAHPDTTRPPLPLKDAVARVTFDFGSGPQAPVIVRGFELDIANSAPAALVKETSAVAASGGSAQVKFVRVPGAYTADLAQRGASGQRIPAATIEVLDGTGAAAITIHLGDVLVSSDRVAIDDAHAGLEQQRLALLDAIAQLTSDLQEAERQQNLTEALDRKKLSSSLEVARVHSQVDLARKRLDNQRERLALLDAQVSATSAMSEQVTLSFARFDLQTAGAPPVSWTFEAPAGKGARANGVPQH